MNSSKTDKLTAIALSVFRLNGQLMDWGNRFAEPHGLTSARWQVLGAISLAPEPPSIPQIADAMGVTRQGVLRQIKLLTDEALVRALSNPAHKRSPLYELTAEGKAAYEAVIRRWDQHVRRMASRFSPADLDAAIRVLSTMSQVHVAEP